MGTDRSEIGPYLGSDSEAFPKSPERAEAKVPRSPHPRRTIRRPVLQSVAAFLQNASVWRVTYPGFHPGLVCHAPLGHSEHPLNYPTWHNAGGKAG